MTSRLRILLMCLMLAALPLQGWASVMRGLCPAAQAMASVPAADGHAGHRHADGAAHVHAAPAGQDVDAAASLAGLHGDGADHRCGLCAACGHAVVPPAAQPLAAASPAPQPPPDGPTGAIPRPHLTPPDKPPRA